MTFRAGGEKLNIQQSFKGGTALGYLQLTTRVNGNVPNIAKGAEVKVPKYTEDYRRVAPGGDTNYNIIIGAN